MLVDVIKKANIESIKQKDMVARSIYSVLLNKIMLENIKKREKSEELVDADVVQILQKTVKELNEEKENYVKVNNQVEANNIQTQIKLVESFLPKMMTSEEIKNIVLALPDKSVPFVMKYFKAEYAGKCDMRMVQEVLKTL